MITGPPLRDLPLRSQLMLMFAFLSITTTVIATVTLSSLSSHHLRAGLRDKSVQYARQLQSQLAPVLAFDDHLTGRELFESLMVDHDLDGLAVYREDGTLLEGRGTRPDTLGSIDANLGATNNHVIAIAPIKSREGRVGRLFVSLNTTSIDASQRRNAWFAVAIATGVALCGLLLAARISRRIARRLVRISEAANRMASGELAHAPLDDRAKDEIGALSHAFNVMVSELSRLSNEHAQLVLTERERLERLVSERTQALERSREMFRLMAESTKAVPFTLDLTRGSFPYLGAQEFAAGITPEQWKEPGALEAAIPRISNSETRRRLDECAIGSFEFEAPMVRADGTNGEMRWSGTCEISGEGKYLRGLVQDVTELRRLERDLTAAQKLESVGRLAAGVAHEINTPVQFVADNMQFMRTALIDIASVIGSYRELGRAVAASVDATEMARGAAAAEVRADLDYILTNAPLALDSSIEGLGRIATIVRSMKQFAHPDQAQKTYADINQAIQSTLVIAHNEYKYVAEVVTEFGELPAVECYLGEINQVVLNILVNASHAIADTVKETAGLGTLTVRTRLDGDQVEIAIGDNGSGIPVAVREKIFDPFFTTKEVGKGTGQGLAIARSVIVNKHAGTLHFETECGRGTTFFIRLPVDAPKDDAVVEQLAA
jgi:signal transduction histidine kinase/HAMP domain-containing protein